MQRVVLPAEKPVEHARQPVQQAPEQEQPARAMPQAAEFQANAEAQVVKGNKAAGARARKAALELMKDLKEFRKESVAASK